MQENKVRIAKLRYSDYIESQQPGYKNPHTVKRKGKVKKMATVAARKKKSSAGRKKKKTIMNRQDILEEHKKMGFWHKLRCAICRGRC